MLKSSIIFSIDFTIYCTSGLSATFEIKILGSAPAKLSFTVFKMTMLKLNLLKETYL